MKMENFFTFYPPSFGITLVYNRASGLRITNIKTGSVFTKMGLRNGDVILGVNDKTITGSEQAA